MSSLKKVILLDNVDVRCKNILEKAGIQAESREKLSKDDLLKELGGGNYDGLVVRSATQVTTEVLQAAGNLKVIGRAGVGVDNIDVESATKRGVLVVNAPNGNTISAAEHTCTLICSLSRRTPEAHSSLKSGKWDRKAYMGFELHGKVLGIVGLGRIGREVATRMQAFGMRTIGCSPTASAKEMARHRIELHDLPKVLAESDIITLHTPLLPSTRHLINETSLATCKRGVRFVNVARGGIIDEKALERALISGQCGGAALDVFAAEPPSVADISHPNLIVTPHLGANTKEAQIRCAEEIAQQLCDFANGHVPHGALNSKTMSLSLMQLSCLYLSSLVIRNEISPSGEKFLNINNNSCYIGPF